MSQPVEIEALCVGGLADGRIVRGPRASGFMFRPEVEQTSYKSTSWHRTEDDGQTWTTTWFWIPHDKNETWLMQRLHDTYRDLGGLTKGVPDGVLERVKRIVIEWFQLFDITGMRIVRHKKRGGTYTVVTETARIQIEPEAWMTAESFQRFTERDLDSPFTLFLSKPNDDAVPVNFDLERDGNAWAFYIAHEDGQTWLRPTEELNDGRFVE